MKSVVKILLRKTTLVVFHYRGAGVQQKVTKVAKGDNDGMADPFLCDLRDLLFKFLRAKIGCFSNCRCFNQAQ